MPFVIGAIITGLLGSSCSILSPPPASAPRCRSISTAQPTKTAHPPQPTYPLLRQIVDNDDVSLAPRRCPWRHVTHDAVFIHFGPQSRIVFEQDAATAK